MPQYTLLIYVPAEGEPAPEEQELQRWFDYSDALRQEGALVAENALEMTDTAKTVRVRDGESQVADGPFAHTDEVLGGYYVIDVPNVEAALEWAARIPSAPSGSVEVRPVMTFPAEAAA